MIGRILVDYAVFIDGKGYLGDAAQIKLPVIEVKSEEYLGGGMVAPQSIPLGHLDKAMEAEFTFHTNVSKLLETFDIHPGADTAFLIRGSMVDAKDGKQVARVVEMRGALRSYDEDALEASKKLQTKFKASLSYYKDMVDGVTHFEIDTQNYVMVVGGKDLLAERRKNLGL